MLLPQSPGRDPDCEAGHTAGFTALGHTLREKEGRKRHGQR